MPHPIISHYRDCIRNVPNLVEPENINGYRLIVSLLENATILTRMPAIPAQSLPISYVALIAVLYQMCGTTVQKFSRDFTRQHPTLSAVGFATATIGKKKGDAWINRLSCAHAIDARLFLTEYRQYIAVHCQEIQELAHTASPCLNATLRDVLFSADTSGPLPASRLVVATSRYPLMIYRAPNERVCLINMIEAISIMEQILSTYEVAFTESLPNQALVVLIAQIVGNNLRLLEKMGVSIDSSAPFTANRDVFAHTNTLSARFENPLTAWTKYVVPYSALKLKIIERVGPDLFKIPLNLNLSSSSNAGLTASPVPSSPADSKESKAEVPSRAELRAATANKPLAKISDTERALQAAFAMVDSLSFKDPVKHATEQQFRTAVDTLATLGLINQSVVFKKRKNKSEDDACYFYGDNYFSRPFHRKLPAEITLSLLDYAAITGQLQWAEILLTAGADPNTYLLGFGEDNQPVKMPLLHMVYAYTPEKLPLFLRHNADPNMVTSRGTHILEYITKKTFSLVDALLAHGADPLMVTTLHKEAGCRMTINAPVFIHHLMMSDCTDAFRLKVLRVFITHIAQHADINKMDAIFKLPLAKAGKGTLTLNNIMKGYTQYQEQKQQAGEKVTHPFQCYQLLRQLKALLESNNRLLTALLSGRVKTVQTMVTHEDIAVATLIQAIKFAEGMRYGEIVTYLREVMGVKLNSLQASSSSRPALPASTSSA